MNVEEALNRGDFGKERYEKKDFQDKVKKVFDTLKEERGNWFTFNANQEKEILSQKIQDFTLHTLKTHPREPLKDDLWL